MAVLARKKMCRKCGAIRDVWDGTTWRCRSCHNAASQRDYYANREKRLLTRSRYNHSDKGRESVERRLARERAGLISSSAERQRNSRSRSDQTKIDALLELHPDLRGLIYPNG